MSEHAWVEVARCDATTQCNVLQFSEARERNIVPFRCGSVTVAGIVETVLVEQIIQLLSTYILVENL